jgi:predicted membrane protein
MFCPNCGNKIVPGAKFCENCGQRVDFAAAEGEAKQSTENAAADTAAASDSVTDTAGTSTAGTSTAGTSETASDSAAGSDGATQNESAGDSAADAESDASRIQREAEEAAARAREAAAKAAEEARRASEDTAKYAKEKAEQAGREANRAADSTARAARETAEEAARQGEALKQQWTPGNMERLAAFAPLAVFAFTVIAYILVFLRGVSFTVFAHILPLDGVAYGLSGMLGIIYNVSKFLFFLLSLAGVVASVQLYGKKENQTTGMAVCLGANVLALIASLLRLFGKGNFFFTLLGIALALFALDALSRVFLRGTGIASDIQPSEDIAAFKSFAENPREKTEQFAAEMKREGTSGKAVTEEVLDPNKSVFDGSGLELFIINLVGALICLVTIGLASPWVICYRIGWDRRHTVYNGRRLAFNGTGIQLFGKWIVWFLLTIVTCGLYSFVMGLKLEQWILSHTTFADEVSDPNNTDVFPNSGFEGNMFEWIGYNLVMGLASGLTCGIAVPWVVCSFNKWYAPNVRISGKRLRFEGSGAELFGQYIIVLLLSIVTCGLYYSWGYVRLRRWAISHLSLEEMN